MNDLANSCEKPAVLPTYRVTWRGIEIEIEYDPCWMSMTATDLAQIQITTVRNEALPMSEGGYAVRIEDVEYVEQDGGPEGYVLAWLDEAARDQVRQAGEVVSGEL